MDVLISCVAENRPEWADRARGLVLSVREFGGALSDAPVVVNFVGGVSPELARPLERLGAEVRVVDRVDTRTPLGNKLRMLELDQYAEFDVLAALDCDIAVAGDFADQLSSSAILAKPADYNHLTEREWRRVFAAMAIDPPAKAFRATSSGALMYPYFNSGVLLVPRSLCSELRSRWTNGMSALLGLFDRNPRMVSPAGRWAAEQVSLGLALVGGELPYAPLPISMNFPTHVPVHPSALTATTRPLVLHYHHEVDSHGFLLRSRCELANPYVDRFNRSRARALGLEYRGLDRRALHQRIRRSARARVWRAASLRHRLLVR